jgi:hypothetical protein
VDSPEQAHALFYPPRVEPAGSVHSIGDPRGAQLVAAGLAVPAAQPPETSVDGAESFKTSMRASVDAHSQPSTDGPSSNRPLSVQADALVAAARRRRKGK